MLPSTVFGVLGLGQGHCFPLLRESVVPFLSYKAPK